MTYKARLVDRGFKEENINKIRKDSPTYCKENLLVMLLIIITSKLIVHSLDVKSTFLWGNKIDQEITKNRYNNARSTLYISEILHVLCTKPSYSCSTIF